MILAGVDWLHYAFMIPMALLSVLLILVILVQRGRGGGLTGALGGMGGASAFGTKAGDLFTKITIVLALVWVLLAMASLKILNQRSPFSTAGGNQPATTVPSDPTATPAGGAKTPAPDGASSSVPKSSPAAAPKSSPSPASSSGSKSSEKTPPATP
ncbi:MAG TPA: preprotein translocase subunit SecG [Pirellulaceae bacterium]|nr:preprotein translocase subunit SecG [Pirellulaceae bacterium]